MNTMQAKVRRGLAVACVAASLGTLSAAAADEVIEVSAKGFMFRPTTVTVKAGTTVTWINLDEEPHTVSSDAGLFRSSALDTRDRFSFTFDKPGTYHYICTIHPRMLGSVIVK